MQWTRSVRISIWVNEIRFGTLLHQQINQLRVSREYSVMQHSSIVVSDVSHRIHVGPVVQKDQNRFNVSSDAGNPHHWGHASSIARFNIGTIVQK